MNRIPDMEEMKLRREIFKKEIQKLKNCNREITNTEYQILMQKIEQWKLDMQTVEKIEE